MTDNDDYIQTIADYFLGKKGKGLILSPGDMALLLTWEAENIPGNAVIRGIDRAFVALDNVLSLHGCRKFVDEEVGKLPRFVPRPNPEDETRERIEEASAMLNRTAQKHPSAASTLTYAQKRVEALEGLFEPGAEIAISEELAIIENGLADSLLAIQGDDELSTVKQRVETSLAGTNFASAGDRLDTIEETLRVWVLLKYNVDFSLI